MFFVQKRLIFYSNQNNISRKNQFGFPSGYSTQKAIFDLLCDKYLSLNKMIIIVGSLFLDISKSFDSLDHDVLPRKIQFIALAENSLNWFRSYLDRRQHFRFIGPLSNSVKYGIPQGSCLGPTLFISI